MASFFSSPMLFTVAWRLAPQPHHSSSCMLHFGLFFASFSLFVLEEGSASSHTSCCCLSLQDGSLFAFTCGCSQNMCMSSDVSMTKDNSLRWQKNCRKGEGGEEVFVAVTARLDIKKKSRVPGRREDRTEGQQAGLGTQRIGLVHGKTRLPSPSTHSSHRHTKQKHLASTEPPFHLASPHA